MENKQMKNLIELHSYKKDISVEIIGVLNKLSNSSENAVAIGNDVNYATNALIKSYIVMNFTQGNVPLKDFLNNFEKNLIDIALSLSNWNQRKAALILGMKPTALFEKIKKYDLRNYS